MPAHLSIRRLSLFGAPVIAAMFAVGDVRSSQRWLVELADNDGTQLSFRVTLEIDAEQWRMYSRPGAVNQLTNWRQRLLGRLTRKLPPKGALLVASGQAISSGDSTVLRGTVESQFDGKRLLRGSLRGDRFHATLAWPTDTTRVVGTIDGAPVSGGGPIRDYRAIAAHTRDSITALVFDPRIPQRANMQEFFRRLDAAAARAEDDLDMVAAFAAHQPLIGISHFGFIRNPKIAATPIDSLITWDRSANPAQWVNFSLYGNGALGYLRVSKWDRATPFIRRAFERMDSAGTKVLVIDLLWNRGGDPTAMTAATYLFRDSVTMGGVVGRKWYAAQSGPPTDAEMARFPLITNEEDAKLLLHIVHDHGGAFARFGPRQPYFGGTVYLLVNESTGSASELPAHLLKSTGRAQLIGKRTAGALLTALPHVVGDGFIVTVPEADYYAKGTIRLEGNGVEPDISTDDPQIAVAHEIEKTMPYAALLLMARTHFNRRNFAEAEVLWTRAMALAPTEATRQSIQTYIDDARRRRAEPGNRR